MDQRRRRRLSQRLLQRNHGGNLTWTEIPRKRFVTSGLDNEKGPNDFGPLRVAIPATSFAGIEICRFP
jgi:hypothetical protein